MNRSVLAFICVVGLISACDRTQPLGVATLAPTVEDRLPDGSLYSSATQSFLRGHHWLDSARELRIDADGRYVGTLALDGVGDGHHLTLANLPLAQLVPRLHYPAAAPPDAFDAYNLMLAEYARNGLSVPTGSPGDTMAYFDTSLAFEAPWTLEGDYGFRPNREFRPFRVGVINNCLRPGLWEVNATDRAGEVYHAWFEMPSAAYTRMVAEVNGLEEAFAAEAVRWSTEEPKLDLGRLRVAGRSLGSTSIEVADAEEPVGFSSQDSRRKLANGFVRVARDGGSAPPEKLFELTAQPIEMTSFVEPGKYSLSERRTFDLRFLSQPESVEIREVEPRTHYDWRGEKRPPHHTDARHLEMTIDLGGQQVIFGNLPLPLLAQQEDFPIHGFGVGILPSADLAEKRRFLIEQGPHPSYAYLAEERQGELYGLNSHDLGLEQIFIRTNPFGADPHWLITISSYERIVDLVKYKIDIPRELVEPLRDSSRQYVSPLYFTYRDDNLR